MEASLERLIFEEETLWPGIAALHGMRLRMEDKDLQVNQWYISKYQVAGFCSWKKNEPTVSVLVDISAHVKVLEPVDQMEVSFSLTKLSRAAQGTSEVKKK